MQDWWTGRGGGYCLVFIVIEVLIILYVIIRVV
jgi:hypothetical protein